MVLEYRLIIVLTSSPQVDEAELNRIGFPFSKGGGRLIEEHPDFEDSDLTIPIPHDQSYRNLVASRWVESSHRGVMGSTIFSKHALISHVHKMTVKSKEDELSK